MKTATRTEIKNAATTTGWGAADVCRVALGLTFVFSGFVKVVDPWGTAIKITEYMNVYGFETLRGFRFGFAIWFCAAELMMGLMLAFKIKTRLVSIFAMLVMTFFLVLTVLSATVLPVEDCGCFGDAVRLSPWGSVAKNVVLWALAFVVWRNARRRLSFFPVTVREWACTLLFASVAGGIGTYCYRHLPLIDFLPYKKGVNLREAVYGGAGGGEEARIVCRDLRDGTLREFAVADTTWYDTGRWEFVEQVEEAPFERGLSLREFAVFNPAAGAAAGDGLGEGELSEFGPEDGSVDGHEDDQKDGAFDATRAILEFPGRVYMLCALRLDLVKPAYAARFEKIVRRADESGSKVVLLTASPLDGARTVDFGGARPVEAYNMDVTTMMTMLRASVGMVVLEDGVIAEKLNCRDVK
jgi:uncharacterized membrane protein YphA (DoxX/SURF4 family)